MKRTWQPKRKKRNRTHGWRKRMMKKLGHIIKKRRAKKRSQLSIVKSRVKHAKKA